MKNGLLTSRIFMLLKEGWTYLASVMDFHDRKIIGYAYGKQMTAELDLQAVKNTFLNVKNVEGIILHSNLCCQTLDIGLVLLCCYKF